VLGNKTRVVIIKLREKPLKPLSRNWCNALLR